MTNLKYHESLLVFGSIGSTLTGIVFYFIMRIKGIFGSLITILLLIFVYVGVEVYTNMKKDLIKYELSLLKGNKNDG